MGDAHAARIKESILRFYLVITSKQPVVYIFRYAKLVAFLIF